MSVSTNQILKISKGYCFLRLLVSTNLSSFFFFFFFGPLCIRTNRCPLYPLGQPPKNGRQIYLCRLQVSAKFNDTCSQDSINGVNIWVSPAFNVPTHGQDSIPPSTSDWNARTNHCLMTFYPLPQFCSSTAVTTHRLHVKHETHIKPR